MGSKDNAGNEREPRMAASCHCGTGAPPTRFWAPHCRIPAAWHMHIAPSNAVGQSAKAAAASPAWPPCPSTAGARQLLRALAVTQGRPACCGHRQPPAGEAWGGRAAVGGTQRGHPCPPASSALLGRARGVRATCGWRRAASHMPATQAVGTSPPAARHHPPCSAARSLPCLAAHTSR